MPEQCRLCGSSSNAVFTEEVLGRYPVQYFECEGCGSLQTEQPFWLAEAYAIPGVHVDVGQAARVLQTWARLNFLLSTIGFDKDSACVDYGGSAGLLTRLMRDSGYRYYAYDAYDDSKYANYFRIQRLGDIRPALISAFEVFEHFASPREALGKILSTRPEVVVFSTQFYEGQGQQWDYLVPFLWSTRFLLSGAGARSVRAETWVCARPDSRFQLASSGRKPVPSSLRCRENCKHASRVLRRAHRARRVWIRRDRA